MKHISAVIVPFFLSLFILLFSLESMAFKPDDFQYSAKITDPVQINTLYKIHLSEELFRKSSVGFKDLRILDQLNNEIPYVILPAEYPQKLTQYYPLKIKDFKKKAGKISITVELPKEASKLNSVRLNIQNRDFSKKIQLEGSSNQKKWNPVTTDMVYDFTSQVDLRKTTINFETSPYRYYRLTLKDMTLNEEKSETMDFQYNGLHFSVNESATARKFQINSITGVFLPPSEHLNEYDEHSFKDFTETRDKEGNSVILLDAGRPVQTMNLMIQNPYFYRNIKIYTSDTIEKDDSWTARGNYSIFKFIFDGLSELQTFMWLSSEENKYYKLVIENKNNPVLKVEEIQIRWPRYYLYFAGLEKNFSYTLHFGSSLIHTAPQYDLSRFVRKDNWSILQTTTLQLSQIEKNPHYHPIIPKKHEDLWERRILYVVVFFGVLTMGMWLYQLLREGSPKKK
jgi:hypothetical protein